jgi:hypothetical protein
VDLLTKGDKSFSNLSKVVSDHLSLYRSEGYDVNSVSTDNEPAMMALRHVIQGAGARHVTGGVKSNNLAKIDRHIRLIKDRVRSILHSLPYSLPRKLIPWAVYFAVSRINLLNHSFYKAHQPSPRELFSGKKVDFKRDLRISFGEYVECYPAATDNTMQERSLSCIALCPTTNKNGSVLFYSLKSGKIIKSDRWISLSHTPESLSAINALAKEATTTDPVFEFHGEESYKYQAEHTIK